MHWIRMYVNNESVTYFNSFGAEHIANKKIKKSFGIRILQQMQIE